MLWVTVNAVGEALATLATSSRRLLVFSRELHSRFAMSTSDESEDCTHQGWFPLCKEINYFRRVPPTSRVLRINLKLTLCRCCVLLAGSADEAGPISSSVSSR